MAPPTNLAELLTADEYQGIASEEGPVVRDWLKAFGERYDAIEFGVRVRDANDTTPIGNTPIDRMWAHLSQYRLDLVARRGHDVDIVEAKVYAKFDAVTQVRNYVAHYRHSHLTLGTLRPVLIAREAAIGVGELMAQVGGQLLIV